MSVFLSVLLVSVLFCPCDCCCCCCVADVVDAVVVAVDVVVVAGVVVVVQSVCHFLYSDFYLEISFGDRSRTSLFFPIVSRYRRTSVLLLAVSV